MVNNIKPHFFFDTNGVSGDVYTAKDWEEIKRQYSAHWSNRPDRKAEDAQQIKSEFVQTPQGLRNFGTRREHTGSLTLGKWLIENPIPE